MDIIVLRHMAWERAKGEMNSMLSTYYGGEPGYMELQKLIKEAIDKIEGSF